MKNNIVKINDIVADVFENGIESKYVDNLSGVTEIDKLIADADTSYGLLKTRTTLEFDLSRPVLCVNLLGEFNLQYYKLLIYGGEPCDWVKIIKWLEILNDAYRINKTFCEGLEEYFNEFMGKVRVNDNFEIVSGQVFYDNMIIRSLNKMMTEINNTFKIDSATPLIVGKFAQLK